MKTYLVSWQETEKHFLEQARGTTEVKDYDGRNSWEVVCPMACKLMAKEICQVEARLAQETHRANRLDQAMRFAIEHQLDMSPTELAQRINQILSDL